MNAPVTLVSGNGHNVSLDEILQREAKERGITPMRLERDLLLKRVRAGGQSGAFLGKAFLSVCDMSNFKESLGRLVYLDAEGFRLFHQILHIRYIPHWSETENQKIADEIETLLSLPY